MTGREVGDDGGDPTRGRSVQVIPPGGDLSGGRWAICPTYEPGVGGRGGRSGRS